MFTLTSALFLTLFATSWIFVLCQEPQELKVTAGEDATLQCQSQGGADITLIAWSRTDLKPSDGYVFIFRDGRSRETEQHPSFRGRVNLRDPERKDGDASVILMKVKTNDTGTYECQIRKEDNDTHSCTIKLSVTAGSVGLKVDLSVLLLLAVGGFMF